jgi:hypothetical protein
MLMGCLFEMPLALLPRHAKCKKGASQETTEFYSRAGEKI